MVETAAGHVLRAVRPHVLDAVVRSMFAYDPAVVVAAVAAPAVALVALGAGDPVTVGRRLEELRRTADARLAAGHGPLHVEGFANAAHNLMRYRPAEVTAAILGVPVRGPVAGSPA